MAGIGFVLRKLTRRGDLLGVLQGYGHSALSTSGPWLLTILALAAISIIGPRFASADDLAAFRIITTYNFGFSLVFSSPVTAITTRYLSDLIYQKDLRNAPGMLMGALAVQYGFQALLVIPFYFLYVHASTPVRLAGIADYFLITGIWTVSVFVSALKEHRLVSLVFGGGMGAAVLCALAWAKSASLAGMLAGFGVGLGLIFFVLTARVMVEFRYEAENLFAFAPWFRKHWPLAVGALAYNMAIWADKWVLWTSPSAVHASVGLISFPAYDSAMFLACLSMVPAMAMFVLSVETEFFEKHLEFYRGVQRHATFAAIEKNQRAVIDTIFHQSRNIVMVQVTCAVTLICLGPKLFPILHLDFSQFGIFRLGVYGAGFHVMFLFITILMSYFGLNRITCWLQIGFLVLNVGFTSLLLRWGPAWYGFGYVLASVIALFAALLVLLRSLDRLPYVCFVEANTSVQS